jgi:hypothetical protein
VANSVNELLDSKTDRVLVMLKKPADEMPAGDDDPQGLSIPFIQNMCEDLHPEGE